MNFINLYISNHMSTLSYIYGSLVCQPIAIYNLIILL